MSVRASLLFALAAAGVAQSGFSQDTGTEGFAPEIRPVEDYEHVWSRSPFVVETKVVAESDPLAQKYFLAAIARTNEEFRVFLIERGTLQRIMIPSDEQALKLVSVSMDRDWRKSSAVIRLGSEQASITYDEQTLNQVASSASYGNANTAHTTPNRTHPQTTGRQPTTGALPAMAVPPPPNRTIQRPGVPSTPEQDDDGEEVPKTKRIIRRDTINTQTP